MVGNSGAIFGKLAFEPTDVHGRHIVYGWLEVGEVIDKLPLPHHLLFLEDHPHVRFFEKELPPNNIYVASQSGLKVFLTESESVVLRMLTMVDDYTRECPTI